MVSLRYRTADDWLDSSNEWQKSSPRFDFLLQIAAGVASCEFLEKSIENKPKND